MQVAHPFSYGFFFQTKSFKRPAARMGLWSVAPLSTRKARFKKHTWKTTKYRHIGPYLLEKGTHKILWPSEIYEGSMVVAIFRVYSIYLH